MSDPKSKFPDLQEISSMAGKLFRDIKNSVSEIICDYKKNHPSTPAETDSVPKTSASVDPTTPVDKPKKPTVKKENNSDQL